MEVWEILSCYLEAPGGNPLASSLWLLAGTHSVPQDHRDEALISLLAIGQEPLSAPLRKAAHILCPTASPVTQPGMVYWSLLKLYESGCFSASATRRSYLLFRSCVTRLDSKKSSLVLITSVISL